MRILIASNVDIRQRIDTLFVGRETVVAWEPTIDRILDRFESDTYDILLIASQAFSDSREGVETLEVLADRCPITQVLFLLEPRHLGLVRRVLRAGMYQYARTPVTDEELRVLIEIAYERQPTAGANLLLQGDEDRLDELIGQSAEMQAVYRSIRQAATTDIPVLIQGETGTGKDLAARVIHRQSERRQGPFVTVNVGAIPADTVARELFGEENVDGALEDAHPGRFEQAAGGTVFLDEIAAIDDGHQVGLLRVIEDRTFRRLGGTSRIRADIRLVASTNSDLDAAVREGSFREDLFYRLDVFRIQLPPLRDRRGDISLLAGHFMHRYNRTYQKRVTGLAPECTRLLESHGWPGNVRELRNVLQRAVLLCAGEVITPDHLPARLRQPAPADDDTMTFRIGMTLKELEREAIVQTLKATNGNRVHTADVLGISRRALYNKMERYGIE